MEPIALLQKIICKFEELLLFPCFGFLFSTLSNPCNKIPHSLRRIFGTLPVSVLIKSVRRKGLVEIFDELNNGQLEEASLPHLVQRMHSNR